MNQSEKCIDKINNVFVTNIIRSWCSVAYDLNSNTTYDQIIWNTSFIRIDINIQYIVNVIGSAMVLNTLRILWLILWQGTSVQ